MAGKLGISYDTLRKYNTVFYEVGHTFQKVKNKVMYSHSDIEILQQFLSLHKETDYSLRECASFVVTGEISQLGAQSLKTLTKQFEQTKQEQHQLNQALLEQINHHTDQLKGAENVLQQQSQQLEALQKYIDTKLEERDRKLMEVVRDLQEVKAAQQKKWWQFWKK